MLCVCLDIVSVTPKYTTRGISNKTYMVQEAQDITFEMLNEFIFTEFSRTILLYNIINCHTDIVECKG